MTRKQSGKSDYSFDNTSPLHEQLLSFPEHIEYSMGMTIGATSNIKSLCIFGIGESSLVGDIISSYADSIGHYLPSYSNGIVPGWVNRGVHTIVVSYSGNNSVIRAVYKDLKSRGCKIYCVTNGGALMEDCQSDGNVLIKIPTVMNSRAALGLELGLLSTLIQEMGICNLKDELATIIPKIKIYRDSLIEDSRIDTLMDKIRSKNIAIYGTSDYRASFKRWKMSFNEDLDVLSFYGELPEFNHNEIVGWSNHHQNDENLAIVMLRGNCNNEVVKEIVEKIIEVLEGNGRHVIDIRIPGLDPLERNLCAIMLGDHVSQLLKERSSGGI